jgi:Carboxypeptidase regulatory-like domain
LLSSAISFATTCIERPPLKPIHCICGVVFFPNGDRLADATVKILQEDKEIAEQKTDDDGKFSFEGLKAGKYEITFFRESAVLAAAEVTLVRPQAKPRRVLAVNVALGAPGCSSFSLADPKKLARDLNPSGS